MSEFDEFRVFNTHICKLRCGYSYYTGTIYVGEFFLDGRYYLFEKIYEHMFCFSPL